MDQSQKDKLLTVKTRIDALREIISQCIRDVEDVNDTLEIEAEETIAALSAASNKLNEIDDDFSQVEDSLNSAMEQQEE